MMQPDPARRLTTEQALQHKFLADVFDVVGLFPIATRLESLPLPIDGSAEKGHTRRISHYDESCDDVGL